jgi:hypothetical protein
MQMEQKVDWYCRWRVVCPLVFKRIRDSNKSRTLCLSTCTIEHPKENANLYSWINGVRKSFRKHHQTMQGMACGERWKDWQTWIGNGRTQKVSVGSILLKKKRMVTLWKSWRTLHQHCTQN